ncbi:MAG TPA: sigma 54-interacting transcriptional regulator [Acidisarcina sp.]
MTVEQAERSATAAAASFRKEDRQPVSVLVVSPSEGLRRELRQRLPTPRWELFEAQTGADAFERLYESECEVLLLDRVLPDLEPVELSAMMRREFPRVQVLSIDSQTGQLLLGSASPTSVSSQLSDVLCKAGKKYKERGASFGLNANDMPHGDEGIGFYSSPITGHSPHQPQGIQITDMEGITRQRSSPAGRPGIRGMVGTSAAIQRVYDLVHLVAPRDTTVVVTGESGTGKDLVAQAIHLLSPRQKQPFVVINCAAIPEPLLEAELFGYVKGAFTGAAQSRIGRIHAAHGGTLFLDEIGDMPLALQSKMLRFLEQGEVQRLGGNDNLRVDVRVVAATNADLQKSVEKHLFREDLYYRLAVFPIHLPPLRERLEDIEKLAESFLTKFSPRAALSGEALSALCAHSWPGNVRELRNVMERATILAGEEAVIAPRYVLL